MGLVVCAVTGQVDKSLQRKRRSHSVRKSQFDVRSIDEITEDDLVNVAYRSKDKIWDKEKVQINNADAGIAMEILQPLGVCQCACAL